MKHIYTSPLCGWDESADRIYVYEFESDDEIAAYARYKAAFEKRIAV